MALLSTDRAGSQQNRKRGSVQRVDRLVRQDGPAKHRGARPAGLKGHEALARAGVGRTVGSRGAVRTFDDGRYHTWSRWIRGCCRWKPTGCGVMRALPLMW